MAKKKRKWSHPNPRKKTHEQFVKELDKVNQNIEVLGTYKDSKVKIKCKCKLDGYEWKATPSKLLSGKGCPLCGGSLPLTHEQFVKQMEAINPDIEIIGTYINSNTPLKVKCKIDGHEWEARPYHLKKGRGCPICALRKASERYSKGMEKFKKEMEKINSRIEISGEYKNGRTNVHCKCLVCGHEWDAMPTNLLKGKGCPKCASSHGERAIQIWLDEHFYKYEVEYKFKDCKYIRPLPFDIYIESLNLVIEFDGQQHFTPVIWRNKGDIRIAEQNLIKIYKRDIIKDQYCKEHGIRLLRIGYWQYDYINLILESYFLNLNRAVPTSDNIL